MKFVFQRSDSRSSAGVYQPMPNHLTHRKVIDFEV